jgi:hypothetical protein
MWKITNITSDIFPRNLKIMPISGVYLKTFPGEEVAEPALGQGGVKLGVNSPLSRVPGFVQ